MQGKTDMCEICANIKLYEHFHSPSEYMECNNYMQKLLVSGGFELTSDSTPLDKIKDEEGYWIDDIIGHVIRCKKCGQHFTCGINTYRGGGSFRKGR
jgi:hypothetical protein